MIPMTTEKKKLCLSLLGIFFVIFILNSFMVRSAGMTTCIPLCVGRTLDVRAVLSADVRRIASFQDIAVSAWSYFLTWGGRIVAQAMAMFFLWMPRGVFNVAIALTVVPSSSSCNGRHGAGKSRWSFRQRASLSQASLSGHFSQTFVASSSGWMARAIISGRWFSFWRGCCLTSGIT